MIIQNFHPTIGGAEKQALTLSRALVKNSHSVTVLTRRIPHTPCRETIDGVKIVRTFSGGGSWFSSLLFNFSSALFLLHHAGKYDVFHVHLASSHAVFPSLLGRLLKKKTVIKLSGGKEVGELAVSRKTLLGRIKLKLISLARPLLVMVNHDQEEEILGSGLGHLQRSFIPNGVDLEMFRPVASGEKEKLRQELGWDGHVFLFVGRFAKDKLRLDIFQNVLEAWKQVNFDGFLVLVGEGPLEADYQKLIQLKNLQDRVKILGPRSDVGKLYQAADVFLLPSITEGLSNAMLEAMACGLPVMGSNVSGINDVIREGTEGCLFDPGQVDSIAKAFRAADKSEWRDEVKISNPKTVQRFDLNGVAARYQALY